ncbi:MAG: class I SAM-dependent RNA methyltransferase [Kofleriaceae bacterium]|nr:class I SAM-dependent RNA methyltransferase [Kofleriaceae bacterium]MBP9860654.1 class I SAM-dependent RNA methyltransferase [Kofleriaceae bacterium]
MTEVAIHALAAGGDGVGRDPDGRAVFVAAAAPGDVLEVELVERHERWARGELVAIVTPGPGRIAPRCHLFAARTCGGCDWAHLDQPTQRAAKHAVVAGATRRLIAAGARLEPLACPEPDWGWRRRARLAITATAIGLRGPRRHDVVDLAACPQLAPALTAALDAIRAVRDGLVRGPGELHLLAGVAGVHAVFAAPVEPIAAAALVGRGGLIGVAWPGGSAGADAVEIEPGLVLAADAFAQAGAAGNAALVAAVTAAVAAAPGQPVLELYAGAGNFTRALVAAGAAVTASDVVAPARPPTGARYQVGPAARVVGTLAAARARFEAIVLDPPRAGAKDVIDRLPGFAPARIVYVSCDPATFARDGERLGAAGYRCRAIAPFDLMPQTAHVELVALFTPG